jgi:hypothetical protein
VKQQTEGGQAVLLMGLRGKLRLYLLDDKGTMNVIAPNGLVLLDPPASK